MSRDFIVALVTALLMGAGLAIFGGFNRPSDSVERQRANLAVAAEEIPKVVAVIDADNRFKNVSAGVYTGQDGAVMLSGFVETDDALFRLMRAVADKRLRVPIHWQVKVFTQKPE